MKITGTFNVEMAPADSQQKFIEPAAFARMTLEKAYSGDLEATSVGEMLSVRMSNNGSAGYVAIEQVQGTLSGRKGRFVLQHYGVMNADSHNLTLEVIPGSGTDELASLTGKMGIRIEEGQHFYDFEYQID